MSYGPHLPPPDHPEQAGERLHDRELELDRRARLNLDDQGVYERPRRPPNPIRRALSRLRAALGRG